MPKRKHGMSIKEVAEMASLFRYDKETGFLYRRSATTDGRPVRRSAKVGERFYKAHVLVWILHNGPIEIGFEIDHIDGNNRNNRISNLRLATNAENQWNRGKQKNNSTGVKGVSFDRRTGRYSASIMANGKSKWLGRFKTKEDALFAYANAAQTLHGEFARHD